VSYDDKALLRLADALNDLITNRGMTLRRATDYINSMGAIYRPPAAPRGYWSTSPRGMKADQHGRKWGKTEISALCRAAGIRSKHKGGRPWGSSKANRARIERAKEERRSSPGSLWRSRRPCWPGR
jgi:hypothetical protein